MDNISKTGTENNVYDIRTGEIIKEPIPEENNPGELSEDNFKTFYQKTPLDILEDGNEVVLKREKIDWVKQNDENEAALNREDHHFTNQNSSPDLMPEGGHMDIDYLDTDPELDPEASRKKREREEAAKAEQKKIEDLKKQKVVPIEEFRKNSKEGEATEFQTGRKNINANQKFIALLLGVLLSAGLLAGLGTAANNLHGKEVMDDNFDQLTEFSTNAVPDFSSRNKAVEWILSGVTQREIVYRLFLVTTKDYKLGDNYNDRQPEWEKGTYRDIAEEYVNADATGEIGRAVEAENKYFFGLLSKPGHARNVAIKEIGEDAGVIKGAK